MQCRRSARRFSDFNDALNNADRVSQPALFDLTEAVKSWLNGFRENHGLIFLVPENITSRFELPQPVDTLGVIHYQIR
jgi:hypothetical protein